jgi:endonuclease/exonuclease/phosphatase (EEP) superfamily protein YafD
VDEPSTAVYLHSVITPEQNADALSDAVTAAQQAATVFAGLYGYRIVVRHQDVTDDAVETLLPGPDSAFAHLLADLDAGEVHVVLVSSKTWLSATPHVQRRMAAMVADHGGTLVTVDSSSALGIAPLISAPSLRGEARA